MNKSRLGLLLTAFAAGSMLLSACGTSDVATAVVPVATAIASTVADQPTMAATMAPTMAATMAPTMAATMAATAAAGTTMMPTAGPTQAAPSSATTVFTGDTIKIGVDLPTSGADASSGIPTRNGVQLAVDQANAAGGVTIAGKAYKLEVYALDDAVNGVHNPDQGAKNAQAFVADASVMAVMGPFNSNVARAIMPILNTADLAQISPSNTNETLTKPQFGQTQNYRPTGRITYFRVCTTDDIQGPSLADYMYKNLKATKIYILDDTETYGQGLANNVETRFKADGGTVLGHDGVPKGTTDFSTIMTKIQATNPDAIFYGGTTSNGLGLARKQMVDIGFNVPFVGGDGIQEDQFIKDSGDAGAGSYSSVAAVNAETLPDAQKFLTDYKTAFGAAVGAYSANAYEATNIIIDGLKRATTASREDVRAAIAATKDFKGVIGSTSFDENGDTTNRWISFYEVKDNAWTFTDQLQFQQ